MTKKILTTEDSILFRQSVGNVRTVKNDKVLLVKERKPKPLFGSQVVGADHHFNDFTATESEKLGIEDSLSYSAPGLQKNVLKKLRKGYFGLDAEIDLHGLNSNEAKRQLLNFLHLCIEDGCRCVLIVHGKGFRSPDNHPVLKNNLNSWLRQHKDVQAFCSASPKAGGTGAIFVLLHLSEKYKQVDGEHP